ncbi:MAG: glycoside hydrolase family 2 protein [Isosphaeraceae bacterium]
MTGCAARITSRKCLEKRRGESGVRARWLAALVGLLAIAAGSDAAGDDGNVSDALLPSQEKLTWGEEPLEVVSSRREQICLNGIWQFVPVLDARETQPPGDLAYIRVPGSWQSGLVSEQGRGPAWQRWGGGTGNSAAWYRRKIKVPEHWAGRAVILSLERVSTDAIIYVNGTKCGGISWPAGDVEISEAVKPGEDAVLCVLVSATTEGTNRTFLDPGRVVNRAAALESRGLIGDVILSSRPKGAHVSDIFVQTSTRKKELKLEVEVAGVAAAGPVQFEARVFDRGGNEVKRAGAAARLDGTTTQTLSLSWTWENPALWDFRQPNLYTLRLKAKGPGLDDEYAQRFGFREFWIEGRRFFLNGTEIHLRPTCHTYMEFMMSGVSKLIDAHIDGVTAAGFNSEEMWPVNHDERGKRNYRELWADRADQKGFLLLGTAMNLKEGQWHRTGYKEIWRKKLEQDLRRYRNHPSIVIWTTNPNWLGHGLDQDPRYVGRRREIADAGWRARAAIAREGNAAIKKLDPTRPVLNHAGSSVGDIYNINAYLNFIPLQEREEWLSEWSKNGDMPLLCVEYGTPWKYSFLRGRSGMQAGRSEPLVTEYCATYLGSRAYALETAEYRRAIRSKFQGGMAYREWDQDPVVDFCPAFQELQALFNRNTYRSWRTWGLSGGMVPWDYGYGWDVFLNERRRRKVPDAIEPLGPFQPGARGMYAASANKAFTRPFQPEGTDVYPAGVALMDADGPTLAWISGPGDAFTAKDHSFAAGQEVRKQAVLINDERTRQDFVYRIDVRLDGKDVIKLDGSGALDPSRTLFVPLQFRVPDLAGKPSAAGTMTLTAQIGAHQHRDSLAFHAFAKPPRTNQRVRLYDPAGKTRAMLTSLGCAVEDWKGTPIGGLIVIGREALSGGPAFPFDLEGTVRAGARVLICTQKPEWLREQLGFRVASHLARRVFSVARDHPVLHGLGASDLADWAGVSTLVRAHPESSLQSPAWRSPKYGWHWGNRGAVTSAAVEKPHRSGWRPILECEFDLAYSPLLELDLGLGRLILSTLDLEDHVPLDAAAAVLAENLIEYAGASPAIPRAGRTIVMDAQDQKAALDGLGLLYEVSDRIEPGADLVIIGRQGKHREAEIERYLKGGGRVLFLARADSDCAFGVKLERAAGFAGSIHVPEWPECRGLSPSDLRWRSEHRAWVVKAGAEIGADGLLGRLRMGNGVAVFCQLDPNQFEAETATCFRLTRWRQTRALAQLLANLGATFSADKYTASLAKNPTGLYHADYRPDFESGDDPYRYFRW